MQNLKIRPMPFQHYQRPLIITLICIISLTSFLFSLMIGSTFIPIYQFFNIDTNNIRSIILDLRLPRTVTAFVSGGLLALSGTQMQLLLQNPLADPYILGISSGALFCILLTILLGINDSLWLQASWLGSLITIGFVIIFYRKHQFSPYLLLLIGLLLNAFFNAGISALLLMAPNSHLHSFIFWLSGDLNHTEIPWTGLVILSVGLLISLFFSQELNLLLRGELEAKTLGLNVRLYHCLLYLLSAILTATAVNLAGSIGFIGLIIPHIARRLVGSNHFYLIPVVVLMGGTLLMLADTLSRTLLAPKQLPIGIMMTLIGIPILFAIIKK